MPDETSAALLAQILSKQAEMGIQLAVIGEQLKSVPDHEVRLRALERWRYALPASVLAALVSAAGAVAAAVHH
jgi:hypothetical protein